MSRLPRAVRHEHPVIQGCWRQISAGQKRV